MVKYPDMRGMLMDACDSVLAIRGMLPHPGGDSLAEYWLDCAVHALCDDCPVKSLRHVISAKSSRTRTKAEPFSRSVLRWRWSGRLCVGRMIPGCTWPTLHGLRSKQQQ